MTEAKKTTDNANQSSTQEELFHSITDFLDDFIHELKKTEKEIEELLHHHHTHDQSFLHHHEDTLLHHHHEYHPASTFDEAHAAVKSVRKPGTLKNKIKIADDFDASLPDEISSQFEGK